MTVIRQITLKSNIKSIGEKGKRNIKNMENLRRCFSSSEVLLMSQQNLKTGWEKNWFDQMDATREKHGHNIPSSKSSENGIIFYQSLHFDPKDCDINGGIMTPEMCMYYAEKYTEGQYDNHEIIYALHKEHCEADGTDRYAVHMAINRTDLVTGRRYFRGCDPKKQLPSWKYDKVERALVVQYLDLRIWGLESHDFDKIDKRIFLFPGEEKVFQ